MPHDSEDGGGAVARWWRPLLGELLATALLMVLGLGSLLPAHELTHPALAFGFSVTALIHVFGGVSGAHMNPAVTLAALLGGHLAPLPALAYAVVQIAGALLGWGLLEALVPLGECAAVTQPHGVSALGAAAIEAVLTGTLALACAATWRERSPDPAASIKLGLTIAGLVYAGGKMTGASLNPARSLAPALFRGCWSAHWAYWLGPLGGAAAAALLHRWVLAPPPPPPRRADSLPLHDKPDH